MILGWKGFTSFKLEPTSSNTVQQGVQTDIVHLTGDRCWMKLDEDIEIMFIRPKKTNLYFSENDKC